MPIFEYQCPTCKDRFEKLVRSGPAPSEVPCPRCGRDGSKRVLSTFASVSFGGGSSSGGSCTTSFG